METHPQLVQWFVFRKGFPQVIGFPAKTNPLIKQGQVKMDMA
jgi:hypothetical protein